MTTSQLKVYFQYSKNISAPSQSMAIPQQGNTFMTSIINKECVSLVGCHLTRLDYIPQNSIFSVLPDKVDKRDILK